MNYFFTKKNIAFTLMGLCMSVALNAQTAHYSLAQLVIASENYLPSLLEKQAIVNSEQAEVKDVKHSFLPTLYVGDEISIGTDNSLPGGYLPEIIGPSITSGISASDNSKVATGNIASFYSQYTIFNFGLHKAQIDNAKSYVDFGNADFQKELYQAKLQICQIYLAILRNQNHLNVDKQNITRYQNIFNVISALAASGIKPGADSSQAKAELSAAKINFNQTEGKIIQLKEQMSFLTGIAASGVVIDTISNASPDSNLNFSMDTINNPLLVYYARQKDIYSANEKVIKKSYLPKIVIGFSVFGRGSSIEFNNYYKTLIDGLGYQRFDYISGIGISYDLFNGLHRKDQLAINSYLEKASEYALQQQRLALQSASSQAVSAMQTAIANLQELPNQTQAAEEVYQQKIAQYRAGLISLIDLTNASFVLYRSQTDFIDAVNDWYTARLFNDESTGNLDLFIQSLK
jgi:outer membrane protein TolC